MRITRTEYLNKLIAFKDKQLIKVVTGINIPAQRKQPFHALLEQTFTHTFTQSSKRKSTTAVC